MVARTLPASSVMKPPAPQPAWRLENGDRLTLDEFERRYARMPNGNKAELIEGVVYMPSPVRNSHNRATSFVTCWLATYAASTPGAEVGDNGTIRLSAHTVVQPDVHLRLAARVGGAARVTDDDYIAGPPELAAEIAMSSVSYDVHTKRRAYRRSGVREYLIWRLDDGAIDWLSLENGDYVALAPDATGVIRSKVFPGLWLAAGALLTGDLATVLSTLQAGLASLEHTEFAKGLAARIAAASSPAADQPA